jgi:hypothetical protein
MSEEQMATMMREFVGTLGKPDVDRSLGYLTDDASWETPEGAFHGKDELRRYLTWLSLTVPDLTVTESGVGVLAQGSRAFFEHTMQATFEGTQCAWLAMCAYEFAGDKIQKMRTVNDRLTILNQAAKGWLEGPIVHSLVKRAERGL